MHPKVHRSISCNSQIMEATQVSINRQMDKEDMVYIYTMEYYSAIKKELDSAIWSNADGPRENYAKWNKSDRKKILYDITYM